MHCLDNLRRVTRKKGDMDICIAFKLQHIYFNTSAFVPMTIEFSTRDCYYMALSATRSTNLKHLPRNHRQHVSESK